MTLSEKQLLIAKRFDELINKNNITQKELAIAINSNETSISLWRNANRPIPPTKLYEIADFFQISLSYLLGEDNFEASKQIGIQIERLRKLKGYDYLQFAKKVGIRPLELSSIERGMRLPTPEEYRKFAEVFNMDIDQLKKELNIDYEKFFQNIRDNCKALGVSDQTIELIIKEIEYEISQK